VGLGTNSDSAAKGLQQFTLNRNGNPKSVLLFQPAPLPGYRDDVVQRIQAGTVHVTANSVNTVTFICSTLVELVPSKSISNPKL
jgi:hypothetical protein